MPTPGGGGAPYPGGPAPPGQVSPTTALYVAVRLRALAWSCVLNDGERCWVEKGA